MKLLLVAGLITVATTLAACNTFEGFGKDVERGGEVIQDGANDLNN